MKKKGVGKSLVLVNIREGSGWFSPGPLKIKLFGLIMCCYLLCSGNKTFE